MAPSTYFLFLINLYFGHFLLITKRCLFLKINNKNLFLREGHFNFQRNLNSSIKKERMGPDQPVALELIGQVKDKTVVIVDDIIDTAKTAINACGLLFENGAKKIIGCFAHAVLTEGAVERIEESGFDKIFVTNTVQLDSSFEGCKKISVLPVDDILREYLKNFMKK